MGLFSVPEGADRHAAELFTHAGVVVKRRMVQALTYGLLGMTQVSIPVEIFVDEQKAYRYVTEGPQSDVP